MAAGGEILPSSDPIACGVLAGARYGAKQGEILSSRDSIFRGQRQGSAEFRPTVFTFPP